MENHIMYDNSNDKTSRINADIYTILDISYSVGWNGIRQISIYRILYLATILYSFRFENTPNPFIEDYHFTISLRGPYYEGVDKSITFLLLNKYILLDNDTDMYKMGTNKIGQIKKIPNFLEKKKWLEIVIHILGIYGEDKIYDFIFRDPEYQKSLQKNSQTQINIHENNETIEILNRFKKAFEQSLEKEIIDLDPIRYLKLYFEYVFSIILKGEAEL